MKKMTALALTLVMLVSVCCSCAASNNTDAAPEKDSTTESTKETTTNDTSTNELGLMNSDMEKIYALIAYDFSTNNIDSNYFTSKDDSWWLDISTHISDFYALSQIVGSEDVGTFKDDDIEQDLILHDMFNVLTTSSQSSETIESSLKDHIYDHSIWKDLFIQNITFSDEQIQTGEALSKEFSKEK